MNSAEKPVKVLHYLTSDTVDWLRSEADQTGRSQSWMIEQALRLWRRRLERDRLRRKSRRRRSL